MKLFKYFFIYLTSKDAETAAKVYNMLYNPEVIFVSKPNNNSTHVDKVNPPTVSDPNNKKEELLESLRYLKSKKSPTKKEKDSIYTLEMVLKNMK